MAGPLDEAAIAERGRDRGQVAVIDPHGVGQFALARLAEHLELLEDEELLRAEAERAHRATDTRGRAAAEREPRTASRSARRATTGSRSAP